MTISLSIFLYIYLFFILIWIIFNVIALYHILRFGQIGLVSLVIIAVYALVAWLIFFQTYLFLLAIDWNLEIVIINDFNIFKLRSY